MTKNIQHRRSKRKRRKPPSLSAEKKAFQAILEEHGEAGGLIYLEGYGWWIKSRPYPPANYYPDECLAVIEVKDFGNA